MARRSFASFISSLPLRAYSLEVISPEEISASFVDTVSDTVSAVPSVDVVSKLWVGMASKPLLVLELASYLTAVRLSILKFMFSGER